MKKNLQEAPLKTGTKKALAGFLVGGDGLEPPTLSV
jgi:hypothetical protein